MATRQSARSRTGASGSDDATADPALPQKKRARHRLIGALALCGVAAVVVPLLLDSEPVRPVNDVPIVIPSKDTPLPARPAVGTARPETEGARAGATARGTIEPGAARPQADAGRAPEGKAGEARSADGKGASTDARAAGADGKGTDARTAARAADPGGTEGRPADPKSEPRAADGKSAAKAADARGTKSDKDEIQQIAEARLRGETAGRYLLQVGAFGAESSASAAVGKVQAAGLRAFTERVKTERGERIRVRVGPFPSREAAERARDTLKSAGIDAAMIAP